MKEISQRLAKDIIQFSTYPLVVMSGLPGVGKSSIALEIAQQNHAVVISTDDIRDRVFGQDKYVGVDQLPQLREAQKVAYELMFSEAKTALDKGQKVVLDATFLNPQQQVQAEEMLITYGGAWAVVLAPVEQLSSRMSDDPKWAAALTVTLAAIESGRYSYPKSSEITVVELNNA